MDNNFKFPLTFANKRKKLDVLDGLPKFSWDEITSQEVIGQGSFGALFITQYRTTAKPAETVVVNVVVRFLLLFCCVGVPNEIVWELLWTPRNIKYKQREKQHGENII